MKDYPFMPGWRQNKENSKPAIKHSILMLTTHGVAEGEWDGNEWIQYRWSCKLKDSDVLYWMNLKELTQLEKEGENLQQEQPEESKWWWSEADSGDLKLVMSLVESDLGEKSPTVLWLKSLPKRFNLLARHVWSEKDIERVATYLHESRHGILWGKAKEMAQDICEILCPL